MCSLVEECIFIGEVLAFILHSRLIFVTRTFSCPWWQNTVHDVSICTICNQLALPLTSWHSVFKYFIMAAAMSSTISACCRWFGSRICSKATLITPAVQFSSLSCTGRVLRPAARLPLRCPRAFYYVKPKEKKGPSLRSWMLFGAGCVGVVTGGVVYVGKIFRDWYLL